MRFHLIYIAASIMVILGAVLAAAERYYARFLVLAGVIFFLLPFTWGCSSPTAPTFSRYRWDVLSTSEGCLHNAVSISRPPDRVLLELQGYQFVEWQDEHVTAIFEVGNPFNKFCSVLVGGVA